jgi:hypothetical protein
LSEVREFFRHCPACGRRFEIRLVGKEVIDERKTEEDIQHGIAAGTGGMGGLSIIAVEESVPVTIDAKDFRYSYRCKHCGHTWNEVRTVSKRV